MVAEIEGETVWPDEVARDADPECLECGGDMHVRSGHETVEGVFKPRCFVHNPDAPVGGRCAGGESDTHKLMKYVVERRLKWMFDHGTVGREVSIPGTDRRADVAIKFEDGLPDLGRGVAVEVQYRNESKDMDQVTEDYLGAGYSVYWVDDSHFGDDYETVTFPDIVSVWPRAVPRPGEWHGFTEGYIALEEMEPEAYPIPVRLATDCLRRYEDELRLGWQLGAGKNPYNIVRRLTDNNADRSCGECGDPADVFLFRDGHESIFRCFDHLPASVEV